MRLLQVDTVQQVKEKIDRYFGDLKLQTEEIAITQALGRTAAEDCYSEMDLPEFDRSTVDGYALLARDTFGAGESLPAFLDMIGKVEMGEGTDLAVTLGKAVYVPTGGMIPKGADAMLMIEYAEVMDENTIAAYAAVAPGEGMILKGDDIRQGEKVLNKGKTIKAQDIGVLAAIGIKTVKVFKKPGVAVISTGDEIVDPFGEITFGQIRDINTYTLAALLEELGAEVTYKNVVKDDFDLLKNTLAEVVAYNDIVLISGGSSVGTKDVTAQVIDAFGEEGVFVHGVAVKPGKPTILGKVQNTAVFGLPGHPVSAIVIFKVFVEYLIDKMLHREVKKWNIQAECTANVHASPGKETYQMVEIEEGKQGYIAKPIHAKSAAISHLAKSHGFIKIPENKEGIKKGEMVKVELI